MNVATHADIHVFDLSQYEMICRSREEDHGKRKFDINSRLSKWDESHFKRRRPQVPAPVAPASPAPASPVSAPASPAAAFSPQGNAEDTISISSDDETTQSHDVNHAPFVVRFQQIGGPVIRMELLHGWMDELEGDDWLSDDMIKFLCLHAAQVVPHERLQVLDPHYYH